MFRTQTHSFQQLIHPAAHRLGIVDQAVGIDRFGDRETYRLARIERSEGVLEDILHFLPHAETFRCRHLRIAAAVEGYFA